VILDDTPVQQNCKGWQKVQLFRKLEYNSTWIRFQNNANGARAFMGNFLYGVERIKRFMKVHLHCIVRNLKKDQRNVDVAPPWKNLCGHPWGRYGSPGYKEILLYKLSGGRFCSFYLPAGWFAPLTRVIYTTENKSKSTRNVHWFGQNRWKLCFLVERRHLGWFFGTVWEFCWLVTLLNLTDRHVFIIAFLFNGEELEQQLYSVHCIGNGLQNWRCTFVESNVPSNFFETSRKWKTANV